MYQPVSSRVKIDPGSSWNLSVRPILPSGGVVHRLLQIGAFEVRETESEEQSVEAFRGNPPDLMFFIDVKNDIPRSWEAVHQIRKLDGGSKVRIVAMTSDESDKYKALAGGCDSFLSFPNDLSREKIGHLIGAVVVPSPKALVVDDLSDNRRIVNYRLQHIGSFDIREAANGQQAIEAFQADRPDLIVMDDKMPVMDGRDATRRIRKLEGGNTVRIIAFSAQCMPGDQERWFACGCDDWIAKPMIYPDLFRQMVERLIGPVL